MNVAIKDPCAAEGVPRRRFTVADVEAMVVAGILDEKERVELIGGELVGKSPKGRGHEVLKIALKRLWRRACPEGFQIAQEATFRLSDDTYLEPDFVVYRDEVGLAGIKGENILLSSRSPTPRCATTGAARRGSLHSSASANFGPSTPSR